MIGYYEAITRNDLNSLKIMKIRSVYWHFPKSVALIDYKARSQNIMLSEKSRK